MLRELNVRNFAIIEDLSLVFGPGLNVLTGETGAGKSIIVGALGLALGQRGYAEMIKTGKSEASVEAHFEAAESEVAERLGITAPDGITARRTLSSTGKSRAYINDTTVTVQSLAELGRGLVDMHGQHDHQSLLSAESQMRLLDSYGGLGLKKEAVEAAFEAVQSLKRRIGDIEQNSRLRAQRLDLLKFQAGEIAAASLSPGEEERLEEQRRILANMGKLSGLAESAYSLLYSSEGSCTERLSGALSALREMASIDPGLAPALKSLEEASPLVEDAAMRLRDRRDGYEADPGRLAAVEDRVHLIKALKRKYGDTIEDILRHRDEAEKESLEIERSGETAEALKKELAEIEKDLAKEAASLSRKRRAASGRLEQAVSSAFRDLALDKAEFKVDVKDAPVSSTGADQLEFLFSANRGEALKPLSKVASGGELSRIMLAIKCVMREADDVPVLVFDEVDAGIGGATAQNVARKLKQISAKRQVLCITHLPQIASAADSHFLIEKGERNHRVFVEVTELSGEQRQKEIARMLSGSITDTSLEHAREIIGDAR